MEVREASASYVRLTELSGDAVPFGYKQTELGVIPDEWEVKAVHEFAGIMTGPFGTLLKAAEYSTGDGVPVISVGEIRDGYFRITEHTPRVSEAVTKRLPQYVLKEGDVVFGRKGGVERSALIKQEHEGWFLGSDGIRIRPSRDLAEGYLAFQFQSSRVQSWLLQHAIGTTMPSLNQEVLRQVAIPLPPTKAEQEAIAEALSDADALIESLEQLIAKKRQIKQGTMQALLTGKQRLPGFASNWVSKSLSDLSSIRSGGTPSTTQSQFWDGDILWCTPTDITGLKGKKYLSDTNRKITVQGLQSSSAELIPANSIVMTSRATIGECAINVTPVATNQGFKNFIPFDDVDVEFLYYLLLMQTEGFIRLCAGSTFLEIGKTQLALFEVLTPPTKAEQTAIATILTDMDTELAELETRLAKTRQLKQGMMQELLTGRIRPVLPASTVVSLPKKKEPQVATTKKHNPQINEAVVIAALTKHFGSEDWPLARVRRTKLAYLLHRHAEGRAIGFLKKAAGPYDPRTRYKGPEGIALKKGYVRTCHNGKYEGFVASEHIAEAEAYFEKWYGADVMAWLDQFHMRKTEELELLTTVDMAVEDLRREGKSISVGAVKQLIHDHPDWKPKLDRPAFSDTSIAGALTECQTLFAT